MFAKQINDAIGVFGIDSMNVKRLKHTFASKTGQDFDTWFISEQELQQKQQEAMMAASAAGGEGVPSQKKPGQSTKAQLGNRVGPSIGSAIQNKAPQIAMK